MIRGFIAGNILVGVVNSIVSSLVFGCWEFPTFTFLGQSVDS